MVQVTDLSNPYASTKSVRSYTGTVKRYSGSDKPIRGGAWVVTDGSMQTYLMISAPDGEFIGSTRDKKLFNEIENSKYILEAVTDVDFDDDVLPDEYEEETWKRAIRFLLKLNDYCFYGDRAFKVPTIQEGPEGTIDLDWDQGPLSLLINIPVDHEEFITFSGLTNDGQSVSGALNQTNPELGFLPQLP